MSDWRSRAKPVSVEPEGSWRQRAKPIEAPKVIEEMHPSVSSKDRAIAKNFAQSPEKVIEYLKQQYPDLEVKLQGGDKYLIRKPGEKEFKVLDPDTGFFSKDFLNDTADVAFDVGAGAVEGGASALGAAGGALATPYAGGAGAIPGAMLAGGATSASNEAIRQKLGAYLGIPQEVDGTDVAISGVIGGASPMLFGAGKARGAIKTAWDGTKKNVLPRLGNMMSGVSVDSLKNYSDDAIRATVDGLEKTGIDDYAGKAYDKIKGYVQGNKTRAGEALVKAIDETGKPVNILPAKQTFKNQVQSIGEDSLATNADDANKAQVKAAFDKYFGLNRPLPEGVQGPIQSELPDAISASKAWDVQKKLNQVAQWEQGMSPETAHMKQTARGAYGAINNSLDEASEGLTSNAKNQYKAAITEEAELLPKFEGSNRMDSIQKTYGVLANTDTNSRKVLKERLSRLADADQLDLSEEAKVLGTFRELGNPKLMPVSSGATTSTSRSIPAAGVGGIVGGYLGNSTLPFDTPGVNSGAGAGLGIGAGVLLGSPASMKYMIRATGAAQKLKSAMAPYDDATRRALRNMWTTEMLKDTYGGDE